MSTQTPQKTLSLFRWMSHYQDAKSQAGVYQMDFKTYPEATLVMLKGGISPWIGVFLLVPSNYKVEKLYRLDCKILEEIMSCKFFFVEQLRNNLNTMWKMPLFCATVWSFPPVALLKMAGMRDSILNSWVKKQPPRWKVWLDLGCVCVCVFFV